MESGAVTFHEFSEHLLDMYSLLGSPHVQVALKLILMNWLTNCTGAGFVIRNKRGRGSTNSFYSVYMDSVSQVLGITVVTLIQDQDNIVLEGGLITTVASNNGHCYSIHPILRKIKVLGAGMRHFIYMHPCLP